MISMARKKYIKADRSKKLEKEMLTCTFCGFCKSVCPYFEDNQWDPSVARGKIALAYGLTRGEIPADESVIERLAQCTTCKDCERRCPSNIRVVDIVEAARGDIAEAGLALPAYKKIRENLKKTKNPYGETATPDFGMKPRKAEIGYFIGCTGRYRLPEIAKHAISILQKLKVDFTLIDEVCCGSTLQRTGQDEKLLQRLMRANIDNIKKLGVKKVIFTCAGCMRMFKEQYPKHVGVDFEVEHLVQFLAKQNMKLKPLKKRIAYHDPCHIGRHMKIFEEPRNILKAIPDASYIELKDNRDTARCCGGGGGVRAADPEAAQRISSKRVKSASEVADLLVTACPFCVTNLRFGNELIRVDIEIRDIAELVDDLLVT